MAYDPQSTEGVPEAGRARLQQNRAGLFTSDLSINEFLLVRQAGFTVTELDHAELPKAPKFVRPVVVGSATAPAAAPSGSARRDQEADGRIPHTS